MGVRVIWDGTAKSYRHGRRIRGNGKMRRRSDSNSSLDFYGTYLFHPSLLTNSLHF